MNEYAGNLHVHSTFSDGTGTVEEIARAAEKAGLDFVGLSDHHTLEAKRQGKEGWHGRVLVLIGMEVGRDHNHYLAWRVNKEVPDDPARPQNVIDAVRAQGGIGFIAHPFEKGCRYGYSGHAFTWEDWGVHGFTGICIWNFVSQWKGPITDPLKALYYYLFPARAVPGPDAKTLAVWDARQAEGKVVAIGGTDAHAFRFGFGPVRPRIFPYSYLFRTINTHILTPEEFNGDPAHDSRLVYEALERGRSFVSFDLLGSGRGFGFTASRGHLKAEMGDTIALGGGVKLEIKLPGAAHVKVVKDGQSWREGLGKYHLYSVHEPGVYRVEVYRRGLFGGMRGWIYSNAIYVRG